MADSEENLEQTSEEVEEVAETPGQEVEYNAEVLEFIKRRKEDLDLGEEKVEQEEPEESKEAASEEQEEAEVEEAPKEEGKSRAARRQLAKEKKLRAEREAFAKEQEGWRAETEEARAALAAFKESKEIAASDPLAHLAELGLSDDDLMDLGREIYYKFMPDNATPAVQAEMAAIQRERRIKKLERQGKKKAQEPEGPTPEQVAYDTSYRMGLTQYAATVDAEKFPLSAKYAKQDFNDLVQGMYNAALQNVQNGATRDLTPEECMVQIEDFLSQHMEAEAEPEVKQTEEEKPKQEKRKAIRNKTAATRPNDKHEDELSYDEIVARSRERFVAKMEEKGFIK
jgi:hypothetical protein